MKKKIKKVVPKYNTGTIGADAAPSIYNTQASKDFFKIADEVDLGLNRLNPTGTEGFWAQNAGNVTNAINTGLNLAINSAGKKVTAAGVVGGIGQGAAAGASFGGPWGAVIGGAAGGLLSAIGTGGSVDVNTGEIEMPSGIAGLFGHSKGYLRRKSNLVKNSILSRQQTENLKTDYYNNPNVPTSVNVLAAEGAVIDNALKVLVSPDELIYDYKNKTLTKVPFGNGKPNTDDNVFMEVKKDDLLAVINNKKEMKTTVDGKTLAKRFSPMIDKPGKKFSLGTIDARDAAIKKALYVQEANKTEPQEYAKFDEGTDFVEKQRKRGSIVAQTEVDGKTYVKLGDGSWYNTVNGEIGKRAIKTPKLRKAFAAADAEFQQNTAENTTKTNNVVIPNGGYDQNWESEVMKSPMAQALFGQNKKYNLFEPLRTVERAGYNYGPTYANYNPNLGVYDFSSMLTIPDDYLSRSVYGGNVSPTTTVSKKSKVATTSPEYELVEEYEPNDYSHLKQLKPDSVISKLEDELFKPVTPEITGKRNWKRPLGKIAKNLSGYLPLIGAMIDKPKYHKEEPIISPAKYIPTGVNTDPIRRAADESYAMTRYNLANINPNTGAGMAYGLQAASNRAKTLSDTYQWQQEQQNKLIAQNVGINNNWGNRYDTASYRAIADTRANEAAADAQRDTRIKDAMGYLRDWQLTPFLKQYLSSGAYKENIERIS